MCASGLRFEVAHDISSRKANKGDKFEEGLYINISFLQLPSHIICHLCFCQEWELQAGGDEKRIILTFEHFDIIPHTTGACIYNYIEISHGNFKWRFCGNTIPEPFTSSGSSMTVKFQSIYQNSNLGNVFLASWNEVAGLSMSF